MLGKTVHTEVHGTESDSKAFFRGVTARDVRAVGELLHELGYAVSWRRIKSVLTRLL
ncbi:hypothetical protein [Desulfosoma caldarium]|nr:hypothetical protein [Desulfosoma caldarium]